MNTKFRVRFFESSLSLNLKSKIQNLKRGGIVALGVTFSMCGAVAQAQQQAKMLKIGWLSPGSPGLSASTARVDLFLREFRKLGYVEGKNVTFERRSADDRLDRLASLADELVRLKFDVLLTPGANGALALKNATRTIPIVFFGASDPVAAGLVDSLARPGGILRGSLTLRQI